MKRSVFEYLGTVYFTSMSLLRLHRTCVIATNRLSSIDAWLAYDKDPREECIAAHAFFVEYIGRIESECAMRAVEFALESA